MPILPGIVQYGFVQAGVHSYYGGTVCQSCPDCTECFAAGWPAQLLQRHRVPILLGIVQYVLLMQAGRPSYYGDTVCQSCWALYSMFCCRLAGTATTEALRANPAGHSSEDLFRAGATPTSHAGISRTAHWTTGIVVSYSTQRTAVHSVHCTATVYSCV